MAVDIGNSSVKTYWLSEDSGEGDLECRRVESLEEAAKFAVDRGIEAVGFLTTRNLAIAEREVAVRNGWWEFTSESRVPIGVDYDRKTLGPDRLAAAVGAWKLFPGKGILIVDAGTALTIDVVAGDIYRGGNISPGMELRFGALATQTSRLPRISGVEDRVEFGRTTAEAITSGVVNGMIYEIAGSWLEAGRRYAMDSIVLTGGNAGELAKPLEGVLESWGSGKERGYGLISCGDLVGRGIIEAYRYNHE